MIREIFPQPKPTFTRRTGQQRRRLALERKDARESAKVKKRSGGRCELRQERFPNNQPHFRCLRAAVAVHHFLGGIGLRGRHGSELARNKIHVCQLCHDFLDRYPKRLSFDRSNAFASLEVFAPWRPAA